MSILIRGMKMPKSCESCSFSGYGGLQNERVVCMFTGTNDYRNQQERFDDCPLVELPPHGRLIDADAFCDCVRNLPKTKNGFSSTWDEESILGFIEDTPTIIEAEDGE